QDAKVEALGNALPARTMKKIHKLCTSLDTHYAEKITGSTIEAETGMNFDYLNRTFRRITGKTVFQYLNRVRINRVKELLKTTDMKLAEIAALTGFSDEFYLSRQFKKATGVSPVLYARGQMKN
ncbi:helix-turn-helix domain-containing protein, partial [Hominenteromicrobium sp.]